MLKHFFLQLNAWTLNMHVIQESFLFGWISFFQTHCPSSRLQSGICLRLIVLWFIGWQCVSSAAPPNSPIYNYLPLLPYIWMPFRRHPSLKETWAICLPSCLLTQASNKPSAGSEHERLKWYTVWKLSIQLLMSKIQGHRGQSCHLSQEEVIITLPRRGSHCLSSTQDPAPVPAATGQTSFSRPQQCPTKCLANPHNPLYSLRAGRMGLRRGPCCLCVDVCVLEGRGSTSSPQCYRRSGWLPHSLSLRLRLAECVWGPAPGLGAIPCK